VDRVLTGVDRKLLWLMSRGLTYREAAVSLCLAHQSTKALGAQAIRKMRATNITQAVALALLEGHIGRWEDCGKHAAYQRHRRLHLTADAACLMAKAEYDAAYRKHVQEKGTPHEPGTGARVFRGHHPDNRTRGDDAGR
jgi:DNA-binding CsgD family transcriptional regulator